MLDADKDGIDISTFLEIITNPEDLQFLILKKEKSEDYSFLVVRGPEDCFRMLFKTPYFAKTQEEVLDALEDFLQTGTEVVTEQLGSTRGADGDTASPAKITSETKVLTIMSSSMITKIIEALKQYNIASTFTMKDFLD